MPDEHAKEMRNTDDRNEAVGNPAPDPDQSPSLVIGLDADDTLWDNESDFARTEERFRQLALRWVGTEEADTRLLDIERANVAVYGYGVKSFVLSMIEGAIDLSKGKVTTAEISTIMEWGKELLTIEPPLLPGVTDTVASLVRNHRVLIITKGDLHHQRRRVQASGLDTVVEAVEIVAEKDAATYSWVLDRHGIAAADFVMVGNSVKSDVLPVREVGGTAIHIPARLTWALEQTDGDIEPDWFSADSITEVPDIVLHIQAGAGAHQS